MLVYWVCKLLNHVRTIALPGTDSKCIHYFKETVVILFLDELLKITTPRCKAETFIYTLHCLYFWIGQIFLQFRWDFVGGVNNQSGSVLSDPTHVVNGLAGLIHGFYYETLIRVCSIIVVDILPECQIHFFIFSIGVQGQYLKLNGTGMHIF